MPRNVDFYNGEGNDSDGNFLVFTHPGRPFSKHTKLLLSEREMNVAHQYVLLNCVEVKPYFEYAS